MTSPRLILPYRYTRWGARLCFMLCGALSCASTIRDSASEKMPSPVVHQEPTATAIAATAPTPTASRTQSPETVAVEPECSSQRFTVLEQGSVENKNDGSGLVRDNQTGLVWTRQDYFAPDLFLAQAKAYCKSRGMRLPSKEESIAIGGTNNDTCAFPHARVTWTTSTAGPKSAWIVNGRGAAFAHDTRTYLSGAHCVRLRARGALVARTHLEFTRTSVSTKIMIERSRSVQNPPDGWRLWVMNTLQLPPSFAAIDFETADRGRDSACAIAIVRVNNGRVVAKEVRLIRPPRPQILFESINGLSWEMLRERPVFRDVWIELRPMNQGHTVSCGTQCGIRQVCDVGCMSRTFASRATLRLALYSGTSKTGLATVPYALARRLSAFEHSPETPRRAVRCSGMRKDCTCCTQTTPSDARRSCGKKPGQGKAGPGLNAGHTP